MCDDSGAQWNRHTLVQFLLHCKMLKQFLLQSYNKLFAVLHTTEHIKYYMLGVAIDGVWIGNLI
jgi:hypothetical protein